MCSVCCPEFCPEFRCPHYFINPLLVFTSKVMSVMNTCDLMNFAFVLIWPSPLSGHQIASICLSICSSAALYTGFDGIPVSGWPGLALVAVTLFFFQFYVLPFRVAAAVVLHPWHVVCRNDTKDLKPFPSHLHANEPWPFLFREQTLSFTSPCKWTLTIPLSRAHPFLHISMQMNPDHSYFESTPFPYISMQMNPDHSYFESTPFPSYPRANNPDHSYFESTPFPSYLHANEPWPISRAHPFLHISMQMNPDHSSFESTPFPSYLRANEPWPLLFWEHTLSFISPCKWTLTTPLSKPHPFYVCKWIRDKPLLRPPVLKPLASVFRVLM